MYLGDIITVTVHLIAFGLWPALAGLRVSPQDRRDAIKKAAVAKRTAGAFRAAQQGRHDLILTRAQQCGKVGNALENGCGLG